jgi:hypothetical protein
MILEKQTENLVLDTNESKNTIKMTLDLDSAQILMNMLSKNLYSDAIGSTIRETASNALDSHRRIGSNDSIIVSFKMNNTGNYEFSVEDFGIGLDEKDVDEIISKYGKSTKRNSANELGMMGLGFKAPLAYSSSFYFTCRKNGTERSYVMYEGEDGNSIDLLSSNITDKRNGVKITVPVKWGDRYSFEEKIKEQLAYFENVYFDCGNLVNNDFKIVRGDDFQISELSKSNIMHICLDNVYYPLDFNALGIQRIDFPIALKFSLSDGIYPTPNRENIRYTKEAKEVILDKIKKVSDYFIKKYNESLKDTDNVDDIFKFYSNNKALNNPIPGKALLFIDSIEKYSKVPIIPPKLKNVDILNLERVRFLKDTLFHEYNITHKFHNGRFVATENTYGKSIRYGDVNAYDTYVYEGKLTPTIKAWLKSKGLNNYSRFCKKQNLYELGNAATPNSLHNILELWKYPKQEWRQIIKEYKYVISLVTKKFKDLGAITVPKDWIDAQKAAKLQVKSVNVSTTKNNRVKLKGNITVKEAESLYKYVRNKNCKFVTYTYEIKNLHKDSKFTLYGKQTDENHFHQLFKVIKSTKMRYVILSDREFDKIKDVNIHNWMDINDFLKGDNIIFKRVITAMLIKKLISRYTSSFSKCELLSEINNKIFTDMNILEQYQKDHLLESNSYSYELLDKIEKEESIEKFVDYSVYYRYLKVKKFLERYTFVYVILSNISYNYDKENIKGILCDLLKYHKFRLNWENYKKTNN